MWDTWGSSLYPPCVACFPELNRRGFSHSLALLIIMGTSMSDIEIDGKEQGWLEAETVVCLDSGT